MLQALPTLVARFERLALDLERAEEKSRPETGHRDGWPWVLAAAAFAVGLLVAKAL